MEQRRAGKRRRGYHLPGIRDALGCLLALLLLFHATPPASALDPRKQIDQYKHDSWTSQRGLPGEAVYQVLQTSDGYLWLRTSSGLCRFDGVRFVQMDAEIGRESVKAIALTPEGDLLVRTPSRTVLYKDQRFSDFLLPRELPDGGVRVLLQTRDHVTLVGADDFIYRLNPSSVETLRKGTHWVNALFEDDRGTVWAGASTQLFSYTNGKLSDGLDMAPYGSSVTAITEDHHHTIWAGTNDGLYQVQGQAGSPRVIAGPRVPGRVTALLDDHHQNLWVGTRDTGLMRIAGGGGTSAFDGLGGLTDNHVLSLFEDREGSLWIGTAGGLDRLRDAKLTTFGMAEGLPSNTIKSVYATRDGKVYAVADSQGLSSIENDQVTRYPHPERLLNLGDGLLESRDGSLWMGTMYGLARMKDGNVTTYSGDGRFAHKFISAIGEDEESLLVATSDSTIFRFKDGKVLPFTLAGRQTALTAPGTYIFTIAHDPSGVLWFGTAKGLFKLDRADPRLDAAPPLLPFAVTSIYNDGDGNLWLGGRTPGLVRYRIRDGQTTHYTAREGLFDGFASHVLPDGNGTFWISAETGIYSVSRQALNKVADGGATTVKATLYGLADGMKTTQAADTASQPNGARTPDGRLWFATYKGITVVDPRHLAYNTLVPPVLIETIVTDGVEHPPDHALTIAPGMKSLEFHYTALSLLVPEKNRFKYRLEGYDTDWVYAGSRRVAYYTNLRPGTYRFHVIACNDDGLWNVDGASTAIRLKPFFHQTPWFFGLCILALGSAVLAFGHLRIRRMQARALELTRLVAERTAELRRSQAELKLLANYDALTSLPNRRMFSEDFATMTARTEGTRFFFLLIDFDRFKHINDVYGHDAGDAFLIQAAARLRSAVRASDRIARLGGDEFALLLSCEHDEASMASLCDRIAQSFADEVRFRGINIATSASIGVAAFPDDGQSQEELYKAADLALYQAKRKGRNTWERYRPTLRDPVFYGTIPENESAPALQA